jgi:NitT/TauT family transport system substrate-binding protein
MNRRNCLTGLAALAATGIPNGVWAQARPIRIGSGSSDQYSLSYFAQDAGFFERASIDVDVQRFTQIQTAVQALAAGELDVVVADPIQVSNAVNNGVPLGFFAPSTLYTTRVPTTFICVAKNGSVRSAKDLENGTVAVPALSSQTTVGMQQWLKENAVDAAKIKLVELSFAAMGAAVSRGTVVAAVIAEPFVTANADAMRLIGDPLASSQSRLGETRRKNV